MQPRPQDLTPGSPVVYCAHMFSQFPLAISPRSIYFNNLYFKNCNIASRLSGQYRIEIFHDSIVSQIPEVDLSTKKTKPNTEKWPESLEVMF